MNIFSYQVYYEFSGRTKDSPFRTEKTQDEINDALSSFSGDICHFIADHDVEISVGKLEPTDKSIYINIATTKTEWEIDEAMKLCMNVHDLFGNKLVC